MKKSLLEKMDELNIEEGIRELIRELWKHDYKTRYSCQGHPGEKNIIPAYVIFQEGYGDGWFEKNAKKFGLVKINKNPSCNCEEGLRTNSVRCPKCGAGVYGNTVYEGILRRK